jgi:hypothetical protein
VHDNEPEPPPRAEGIKLRHEIAEGLTFVTRHPILKRIVACTGTSNFFSNMFGAVEVVFLVRHLHANPTQIGVVYTLGAIGGIVGALLANRLTKWIGSARIVWLSILATAPFMFVGVFAFPGWGIGLMSVSAAAGGFGSLVYNVAQVSYRQSICPPRLLGRMNAAVRFIVWGTMPLGALAGGVLGSVIGVRETLAVGAGGMVLAAGWVMASPLFGRRDFPPEEADALEALLNEEERARLEAELVEEGTPTEDVLTDGEAGDADASAPREEADPFEPGSGEPGVKPIEQGALPDEAQGPSPMTFPTPPDERERRDPDQT